MSDVPPVRQNIQIQAVQFTSAVSENLAQGLAQEQNFINYFQMMDKRFNFNGPYNSVSLPIIAADGMDPFEFNSQIIDVWLFCRVGGSSGYTEIDIEVAATPAGPWTSIFTTRPRIYFNAAALVAGSYVWVGNPNPTIVGPAYTPTPYVPPANTVQPVLNAAVTSLISAWSAIRCNLTSAQGGSVDGCGALVRYRPV